MKKNFLKKYNFYIFILISFITIMLLYLVNFDTFNDFNATDFRQRYRPNGILIINQIVNLNFKAINFFNFYFIPELITGLMMKFFLDQTSFSIAINILNIIFLVSSFYFFFRALNVKNTSTFIFFVILFYIYIPNWIWVFWKLADIYFLFIFSVSFYFLSIGLRKNKFNYLFYSFCICLILLITKPQGLVSIPFFIYSLLFIKFYKKNFFSMKFLIFILYFLFFPFLVYVMIKLDFQNYITRVFTEGRVSFNILISYKDFLNQFSLISSNISELFYYYYLFIQKLIFQLTFVRETYSYSHNIFLLIYILTIYLLFVINLDYLVKNYNLFFKLTVSITFFSILLYCSTFTGSEPNRFQIFHLVPIYILVCLSISRSLRVFFNIIFK